MKVRPPADIVDRLAAFRDLFSAPQFRHLIVFVWGVMLSPSRATLSKLSAVVGSDRRMSSFARFLSQSPWSVELLAERLLRLILKTMGNLDKRLILALDDTDAPHPYGKKIFGLSRHFDADAPKDRVVTRLGHCGVSMSLLLRTRAGQWLGFCLRAWLYIREKDCPKGWPHRGKLELAVEMMKDFRWPPGADRLVIADAYYAKVPLANADFHLLSRLTGKNVFFELPPPRTGKRGRPRAYGKKWTRSDWPEQADFTPVQVCRYGMTETVEVASIEGKRTGWKRPCRILAVRDESGKPLFLVTTDLAMSPAEMIELYAARFQIELGYREMKTDLGLGDGLMRSREGFHRYVHLMMLAPSLLKLAAVDIQRKEDLSAVPSIGEVKSQLQRQQSVGRIFLALAQLGLPVENPAIRRLARLAAG